MIWKGDRLIACLFLVMSLPLLALVACAIKWESPGPVLQGQDQISRTGRRFTLLRFRTTEHDAGGSKPPWRAKRTRVGQFLDMSRIAALPQLINVLRGEMRLIDTSLFE